METRPYFVLGDVFTNVVIGAAAAVLASKLVPPSWSVLFAMPAAMFLGMLVSIPIALAASPLFGAFEIMLPGMLSGMMGGMIGRMPAAMAPSPGPARAAAWGAGVGVATVLWVYALTAVASRGSGSRHGQTDRA
jgi:hypothetical protein